jgi:hypothetical protein
MVDPDTFCLFSAYESICMQINLTQIKQSIDI